MTEMEKVKQNPSLYSSPMTEGEIDSSYLLDDAWVKEPREHKGTLIWLHGIGELYQDTSKMFEMLAPKNLRVVVPRAPQIPVTALEEKEERAWFDLEGLVLSDDLDEDYRGVADSADKIFELIDAECKRIDASRILIAGFAQGGAMAIHCGLSYKKTLGGVLCSNGYVVLPEGYPDHIPPANQKVPVLAINGNSDEVVPIKFARKRFSVLKASGVPFEFREDFHLTHHASQEVMFQLQRWIEITLGIE
eukprot:CAMPEP_0175120726 /NCGR_PEP_ID=MMETSP0087-20121206/779_1 /TAXON_ID=136419 /ORGANISM="Unknown Unknown, Strain D1" /LENGTH=247 /DNA_ID=CAMNT_0016402201 /DNA_START=86 /DNA_END=829 /DNA_ORIENTATION=+